MATDTSTTSTQNSGTTSNTGTGSSGTPTGKAGAGFGDHAPINWGNLNSSAAGTHSGMHFLPPSSSTTSTDGSTSSSSSASSGSATSSSSSSSSTITDKTAPAWMSDAGHTHHDWTVPSSTGTSTVTGHDVPSGGTWSDYHPASSGGVIATAQN